MIKKPALMFLILLPTVSLPMLLPTARQLACVAVASSMRQSLHPVTHDANSFAYKRWYSSAHEEMQHANVGEDRDALAALLRECRYQAYEWGRRKQNSADLRDSMLFGYGMIAGGVFGLTGCTALVEALVFGATEPHFFHCLFTMVTPTVMIGGSPAVVLGVGAHAVSKIADVQERRSTEKAAELSRSLQLLNALAAAEKKTSITDETKKTDA